MSKKKFPYYPNNTTLNTAIEITLTPPSFISNMAESEPIVVVASTANAEKKQRDEEPIDLSKFDMTKPLKKVNNNLNRSVTKNCPASFNTDGHYSNKRS